MVGLFMSLRLDIGIGCVVIENSKLTYLKGKKLRIRSEIENDKDFC